MECIPKLPKIEFGTHRKHVTLQGMPTVMSGSKFPPWFRTPFYTCDSTENFFCFHGSFFNDLTIHLLDCQRSPHALTINKFYACKTFFTSSWPLPLPLPVRRLYGGCLSEIIDWRFSDVGISTQICELLPLEPSLWMNSPPPPALCE
jgi:hypothetical protein